MVFLAQRSVTDASTITPCDKSSDRPSRADDKIMPIAYLTPCDTLLLMDTIGQRLKLARERRGLSQPALAKLAGVKSSATISMIERGERNASRSMLEKLAPVLAVSVEWLLVGGDQMDGQISNNNGKDAVVFKDLAESYRKRLEAMAKFHTLAENYASAPEAIQRAVEALLSDKAKNKPTQ